jgi:hypothetical protein
MNTAIVTPEVIFTSTRTARQQYEDGFSMFCDCDRTGDYLSPGELAALTESEMKGYNAAIRAKDDAEHTSYLSNTNAYGDRTEW